MPSKKISKINIPRLIGSVFLSGVLSVLADVCIALQGIPVRRPLFLLGFACLSVLLYRLFRNKPALPLKIASVLFGMAVVVVAVPFLIWGAFSRNAAFEDLDQGKQQLYAGRRVMAIVPHQDDEINLLGGVLEEYVSYGSEVYVVFVTNGDALDMAEVRAKEALEVARHIGIPGENLIYLGYGDSWAPDGPHIYNAPSGEVLSSLIGRTETYSTEVIPAWREGAAYTIDNYREDIKSVILTYRPDVLFCTDYDDHIDHKSVTLTFDSIMGQILKEVPDYRPLVLKGYAYNTAWFAPIDCFTPTLLSTQDPSLLGQYPNTYRWEERLRLPVQDACLSRSLLSSRLYTTLALYDSQYAHFHANSVINSDKVFWHRSTGSLCYDAQITAASGDTALLNDFMLIDNYDLVDESHLPHDGVWVPEGDDRSVSVTFPEPRDIHEIVLYDAPSPEDDILEAIISFSDGTELRTGPLDPGGAATAISVGKTAIDSFTVTITESTGQRPGLAEIEAYPQARDHGLRFLKLMDSDGNFLYDYWTPSGPEAELTLYSVGLSPEELDRLTVSWDGPDCEASWDGATLRVSCPEGETMVLTLAVDGTDISDTIRVSHPTGLQRLHCSFGQWMEKTVFQKYWDRYHLNSATFRLYLMAKELFV